MFCSVDVLCIFLKAKLFVQFLSAIHRSFQSLTPAIETHLAHSAVRTLIF